MDFLLSQLIHISGFNTDQAEALIIISQQTGLKINEVLFSGILISGLGAVMDVGMSIASSLYEVKALNPQITKSQLFKSGINIGKDMIGTMSSFYWKFNDNFTCIFCLSNSISSINEF